MVSLAGGVGRATEDARFSAAGGSPVGTGDGSAAAGGDVVREAAGTAALSAGGTDVSGGAGATAAFSSLGPAPSAFSAVRSLLLSGLVKG